MSPFSDYIDKQAPTPGELPLVHTTEYFRLASIHSSNTLTPRDCKIFKEPLLYFFYGRPAYRDSTKTTPTRDVGFYPICFVFGPGTIIKKAKRVYPFDSGASQDGLYEPAIKRADALAGYLVPPLAESARKIVTSFFDTDLGYLAGSARSTLTFASSESEAESYHRLIKGGGDPKCDDRCSAVEIQITDCLDIRQDLKAIVLPTCFLEDAALAHAIVHEWHAQPLTYGADIGMRPLELHGVIRHLVREYYRQEGLI